MSLQDVKNRLSRQHGTMRVKIVEYDGNTYVCAEFVNTLSNGQEYKRVCLYDDRGKRVSV